MSFFELNLVSRAVFPVNFSEMTAFMHFFILICLLCGRVHVLLTSASAIPPTRVSLSSCRGSPDSFF